MTPYTLLNEDTVDPHIFSCEHASNKCLPRYPPQQKMSIFYKPTGDGISERKASRHLVESTDSQGILATYSRLWIDLNHSLTRTDLVRLETEDHVLSFNHNLSSEESETFTTSVHSLSRCLQYMVQERCNKSTPVTLISIHSFTPVWNGTVRTMDIGVLFDECEELGRRLAGYSKNEGLFVEINAPYTGRGGLMYSVEDKGKRHRCPHLELKLIKPLFVHRNGKLLLPPRSTCSGSINGLKASFLESSLSCQFLVRNLR